ncbi:MAG: hypothetical protein U0326_37885 [Polyangiales bacterium]
MNLQTDVNNCGACARVCNLANANESCAAGACGIASCLAGFGNCDAMVANGCETNLNTTPASRGALRARVQPRQRERELRRGRLRHRELHRGLRQLRRDGRQRMRDQPQQHARELRRLRPRVQPRQRERELRGGRVRRRELPRGLRQL